MNTPFKLDLEEIADAAQAFRNALLDLMPFVAGQHAEKLVNDELARFGQLIDLCVKKEIVEPLLLGGNSSARVYGDEPALEDVAKPFWRFANALRGSLTYDQIRNSEYAHSLPPSLRPPKFVPEYTPSEQTRKLI
jgi:hypothetical protein